MSSIQIQLPFREAAAGNTQNPKPVTRNRLRLPLQRARARPGASSFGATPCARQKSSASPQNEQNSLPKRVLGNAEQMIMLDHSKLASARKRKAQNIDRSSMFKMKACIPIFVFLTLAIATGCIRQVSLPIRGSDGGEVRDEGYTMAYDGSNSGYVDYGFTDDHLHFVVFESAYRRLVPHAKITWTSRAKGERFCSGYIDLPDGSKPDLPTSNRIFELTFGKFASMPINFTRTQLKAYLDTDPMPPTIEALERFISKHPQTAPPPAAARTDNTR
jgi:hypothetical protein